MKYLKILLAVGAALWGGAMASAFNVYVRNSDAAYSSSDIDRIVLNADRSASVFFKAGGSETIPAGECIGVSLMKPASGVESVEAELSGLRFEGGFILGEGRLTLTDVEGRVCAVSDEGRLYVGDLRPGVYVISNGQQSSKILLR